MNHPIISSANGQAYHNEMIETADNYRRVKQMQSGIQPLPSYLARFFNFLVSITSKDASKKVAKPGAPQQTGDITSIIV